ncbi:MAG: pyridoxal phosphate-dependent aminotransferase [Cyanobacteria bacterium J06626_18]
MAVLSRRVDELPRSFTMGLPSAARAMLAEGLEVSVLRAGQPDFNTPPHIVEAAIAALETGKTTYGPPAGIPALRGAIARKLRRENRLRYESEAVVVTNGAKQALFNLMQVLLEPGDEVIIPAPYWLSYPHMVHLAGGKPVIVATDKATGCRMTPDQLQQAITPRTRLVIFNSPSNPTGVVYTPAEVRAIAEVIVSADVKVVSDEIYEHILYDEAKHLSIGSIDPEVMARTITVNGLSKAYAMTGWRVGYVAAPLQIAQAVTTLQGHSTSNVCTFAQYGAIAALEGPQDFLLAMRRTFAERRRMVIKLLDDIPGLTYMRPDGAFYVWVDISQTGLGSEVFCDRLLTEAQVAAVPGIAFGADDHIRLSYAVSKETLESGLAGLNQFMHRR